MVGFRKRGESRGENQDTVHEWSDKGSPEYSLKDATDEFPVIASAAYDIWSLGALLFYLCTGETLWKADGVHNF